MATVGEPNAAPVGRGALKGLFGALFVVATVSGAQCGGPVGLKPRKPRLCV
jgi:hypothetical protein